MSDLLDEFAAAAREAVPVDEEKVARVEHAIRSQHAALPTTRTRHFQRVLSLFAAAAVLAVSFRAGVEYARRADAVGRIAVATDTLPDEAATSRQMAGPGTDGTRVTFLLVAPTARAVSVVGAFNDWTPGRTELVRNRGNVWSVVVPLKPGSYTYAFVVDGHTWLADPAAPRATEEDFGRPNSVIYVEDRHEAI